MKLKRTLLAYVGAFAIAMTGCGSEPQAPLKNPENGTESVDTNTDTGTPDTDNNTGNGGANNSGDTNTGNTDTGSSNNNGSSGNTDTDNNGSGNNNNSDSDNSGSTGNTEPSTGGIDNTAGSCEPMAFAFSEVSGFASAASQVTKTYATNVNADNTTDFVVVESYQGAPYNGPSAPGIYELDGSNYSNCGLCVLVYKGCSESSNGLQCQKYFYAEQGTVQINELGGAGSTFDVELQNMELVEVTIDSTFTSVPVPSGENWCVHGYNWTTVLDDGDAPAGSTGGSTDGSTGDSSGGSTNPGTPGECSAPENGTGMAIGDQIGNFTLTNCNGDSVSLHDSCGSSRITWLIGSATWCGYCPQQIAEARQAQQQVGADNLAFYVVADDVTSQSGCFNYAQAEGVDPSQMLYATQSSAAMNAVLNRIGGIGQGFPMNALMNGYTMELLFAGDGYVEGLGNQVIEALNQ
jgi:hypothetical protein